MFKRLRDRLRGQPSEAAGHEQPENESDSSESVSQPGVLTVDNRRYALDQLPEEVKADIAQIKRADLIIKLRQDKVGLLRLARQDMLNRLRQGLADQNTLDGDAD